MAWTCRAKFYCAAGDTTLNFTDYGAITLYTKKKYRSIEVSAFFRVFGEKLPLYFGLSLHRI